MVGHDARDAAVATLQIVRAPLHASSREYLIAGGLLGGVALTSTLDRTIHSDAIRQHGRSIRTIDDIGHVYQGPLVNFGTAGLLYGCGLLANNRDLRRTGAEIVEAFGVAGAGAQVIKYLLGRNRPYAEKGPFHFVGPNLRDEHHSFPSGDVTVAFAYSSVLAAETKSWPVATVLYGLAGLTAFQRLNTNKHWLSDTVGGAAWGTAAGWGVVHVNAHLGRKADTLTFAARPGGAGLQWSW